MRIKKITKIKLEEKKIFYDITVDKYHNFVIGDSKILTHNTSLNSAVIGMAQSFKNSLPLLEEIGQFGSMRSPEAGAPRYISTKLNGNFRLIYKDFELLNYQIEEGDEIEPNYFLPIIPTVLLNGSSGIAVGFATNILNRNPIDLIDCCLKSLDGKKFNEPLPWWKDFKGTVKKLDGQESSFQINGVHEIVNTNTVHISELPPSMTYSKYENWLNQLINKGSISTYDDNCKKNIDYTVKFNRAELNSRIDKGQLEGILKLYETETENLTCLDEHGKLIIFKNIIELINYFVKFRLTFYDKRKAFIVAKLKREHSILTNRAKFIKAIIDGNLKINNRPKSELVIDLEKMKFDKLEDSYTYLLSMAIHSLTKETYESLLKDVEVNENLVKETESLKPTQMYIDDLKELRKKLIK